ncbi:uncharacterized protein TrAFT101_000748 [Trichoderma asperellum]|uniref:uncharacterized protein n=1 Tax=Trichoderma asperellum TaxID=101201 RepID=UPI0033337B14|nr:hypothetical protein TrAFT101_000748 [Trichoderma asperellum]
MGSVVLLSIRAIDAIPVTDRSKPYRAFILVEQHIQPSLLESSLKACQSSRLLVQILLFAIVPSHLAGRYQDAFEPQKAICEASALELQTVKSRELQSTNDSCLTKLLLSRREYSLIKPRVLFKFSKSILRTQFYLLE